MSERQERLIRDRATQKRMLADDMEREAARLRKEADGLERQAEQPRVKP